MRLGIIGKGFGLYGYLPAVIDKYEVVLPLESREIMLQRHDIRAFISKVEFSANILENIDSIIIATTPLKQERLILEALKLDNITNLFLEKPLARSAYIARELLGRLESSHKAFKIGYILFYTPWFKLLKSYIKNAKDIKIKWRFRAYHIRHNISTWKSDSSLGGGVLSFYAIHFLALLAYLKINKIDSIISSDTYLFLEMSGISLEISCDSDIEEFSISIDNNVIYKDRNIFSQNDMQDSRIGLIREYINDTINYYECYKGSIALWEAVESKIRL